jgi:predicted nucleotidyltransferase
MIVPDMVMQRIQSVLTSSDFIGTVILFGSRARGDCRDNSDIDLAIVGEAAIPLMRSLKDAGGLYKVDVVLLSELDNENLRKAIDRDGICIYTSSSSAAGRF